ncbi:MAG: sensor histidine kinase, partial [Acidimicrobiales bacterium]
PGAEAELARLAESINAMAAELERARGLERQFLLSVSHELRTPLTSVRGFAEAIADGAAPDTRRAAEIIGSEARRLERLVGDLLDLAKLDARSFSLHMEPVDVAAVVVDTAEGFRPAADVAGLVLDVAVDGASRGGALVASADPERLAQVVANLVENALKFAAGRITVSATREDGHVVLAVADDGPGIAKEDRAHVFDRLFQSSRTPARQAGSGLGLTIVAELASAMGATVAAQSVPGATRLLVQLRADRP